MFTNKIFNVTHKIANNQPKIIIKITKKIYLKIQKNIYIDIQNSKYSWNICQHLLENKKIWSPTKSSHLTPLIPPAL